MVLGAFVSADMGLVYKQTRCMSLGAISKFVLGDEIVLVWDFMITTPLQPKPHASTNFVSKRFATSLPEM